MWQSVDQPIHFLSRAKQVMYINNRCRTRYAQSGFTIVELIIFIVIVSTAVAGILTVMNITTANSVDPQIRKQALSIAEALMEEASLAPYTYCDSSMTDCTVSSGTDSRLQNYNGPVNDINSNPVSALNNYTATVAISNATLNGVTDALHIVVTVTNGSESIALDGYRTRYVPGTL